MYIVAVVAEKGGVGKTTLALDLAVTATHEGGRVALLDVDPQATASKWTDRRTAEFPWVVPTPASRLTASIAKAKTEGIDFIVIDTAPHSATDAAEAARLADVVITPVEPHLYALETIAKLAQMLKITGTTSYFAVINKAPIQGREAEIAVQSIKDLGFPVAPVIVHFRAAHRHAGNIGKVASEYEPNGKAAQETLQLYSYTRKFVDTKRRKNNA